MLKRKFGFKEVLLRVKEDKAAEFSSVSSADGKAVVEAEVVEVGKDTEFYKEGDRVLVKKSMLMDKVNHSSFSADEYLLEFERQIICKIV